MNKSILLIVSIGLNISSVNYLYTASPAPASSSWSSRLSSAASSFASGAKKTGGYLAEKSKGVTIEGTLKNIQDAAQTTRDTAEAIRVTKATIKELQEDLSDAGNELKGAVLGDNKKTLVTKKNTSKNLMNDSWLNDEQEITNQTSALATTKQQLATKKALADKLRQQLEEQKKLELQLKELEEEEARQAEQEDDEAQEFLTEEEQLTAAQELQIMALEKKLEEKRRLIDPKKASKAPTKQASPSTSMKKIPPSNTKATQPSPAKPMPKASSTTAIKSTQKTLTIKNNSPYTIKANVEGNSTIITIPKNTVNQSISINKKDNTTIKFTVVRSIKETGFSTVISPGINTITITRNDPKDTISIQKD